jgi:hypothetical protein
MHNCKTFRYVLLLAIAALLVSLAPAPGSAKGAGKTYSKFQVAGIASDKEMLTFFAAFKAAVATGDRARVAAMVSYPLDVVTTEGERLEIAGQEELLARFDAIFDGPLREKIAVLQGEALIANSSGVTTPLGEVWFRKRGKGGIRVTTINGVVVRQ